MKTLALPPRSPNLNAYAERWVRSVKEECLAKLILLGEGTLRRGLCHYQTTIMRKEITKAKTVRGERERVRCRERLGGLLKYHEREAA